MWLLDLLWRNLCIHDWLNLKHRSWCYWLSLAKRKTGAPKQRSDCDLISPLVILRGWQIRYKRGSEWTRHQEVIFILSCYASSWWICFNPHVLSVVATKLSKCSPNDTTRGSALELTVASSWPVCHPFTNYFPFPSHMVLFSHIIILSYCFYFNSFLSLILNVISVTFSDLTVNSATFSLYSSF